MTKSLSIGQRTSALDLLHIIDLKPINALPIVRFQAKPRDCFSF